VAIVVIGGLMISVLLFPLVGFLLTGDPAALKSPGYRVTRIVGFAIAAAGVAITFLPVSTDYRYIDVYRDVVLHADCGSVWQAMFTNTSNPYCSQAAFPHLWIAGGVAAVGLGIAFWGASRGRLVAAVCVPLVATGLIHILGLVASSQMHPEGGG
jgi:hypothetical protein